MSPRKLNSPLKVCAHLLVMLAFSLIDSSIAGASDETSLGAKLVPTFELGGQRSIEPRYYVMETQLLHYEDNGSRRQGLTLRLYLEAHPESAKPGNSAIEYRCRRFTVKRPGGDEIELPTLSKFAYSFDHNAPGIDEQGQVFGIPHSKFAMLVDSRGDLIDTMTGYMVYNSFIDFHGLNDVFASQGAGSDQGLGGLHKVGDSVVHSAAQFVAPVHLGDAIKEGSVFRNGRVTLELKGLSEVQGRPSALLGYDSGESSFVMIVEVMQGIATRTEGGSHYFGDLYVDLETRWLNKATLHEIVVSQTTTGRREPESAVLERTLLLEARSKQEFEEF